MRGVPPGLSREPGDTRFDFSVGPKWWNWNYHIYARNETAAKHKLLSYLCHYGHFAVASHLKGGGKYEVSASK